MFKTRLIPLKKYFLLCLFSGLGTGLYAQQTDREKNEALLKSKDSNVIYNAYVNLCIDRFQHGESEAAINYGRLALPHFLKIKDSTRAVDCYLNLGHAYSEQGAGNAALSCYLEAMKINEARVGNKKDSLSLDRLASVSSALGAEMMREGEYEKAKYYLEKALKISTEVKDLKMAAGIYNNLGILHRTSGNYYGAEKCYRKSLELCRTVKDIRTYMQTCNNLAYIEELKNELDSAEKYYMFSLNTAIRIDDQFQREIVLGNLGALALAKNDLKKAEEYFLEALKISTAVSDLEGITGMNLELASLYKKQGRFRESAGHYEKYIALKKEMDKVNNERGRQQAQLRYEFEKEKLNMAKEQEKQSLVEQAEKRKQRTIIWLVSASLAIVALFLLSLYKRYKITAAQKTEIESQKKLIELKQKEIVDSIHYAQRIQVAQIPSEKRIWKMLEHLKRLKS